jgi:transcriptional regulator with XRE-family HTH domain
MESNADWILTDADLNAAIGAELRSAREAAGLSRPELVAQLPFTTTVATLLNWELGKRATSYAKLVEIARALHRRPADLLDRAVERVESIQSLMVELDLRRLCEDTTPRFGALQTWAVNRLAAKDDPGTVVRVHHSVIREWAVQLKVHLADLVRHLERTANFAQVNGRGTTSA